MVVERVLSMTQVDRITTSALYIHNSHRTPLPTHHVMDNPSLPCKSTSFVYVLSWAQFCVTRNFIGKLGDAFRRIHIRRLC